MSLLGKIGYYRHLYANIENVSEYHKNRKRRNVRPMQFITKPYPIRFAVSFAMYPVFREIFCWDAYQINSLVKKLPPDATIIDVGANCGFFDVLLLSKLPNVRILAFEPLPVNVSIINCILRENIAMQQQVQLFAEAVTGKVNGQLELYVESSDNNSEVASVYADFDKRNTRKISVPCSTLSKIISESSCAKIDLLKLDCEGSEYDILYQTPAACLKKVKHLAMEVHNLDDKQRNVHSMTAFLKGLGFKTTQSPLGKFCYYLQASMP